MDLRVGVSAVVMNWLIMLYFIILFAERVQSIVRSIRDKDVKLFGSGFNSYVYLAVFLSLAAFLVLLAVGNASFLKSLFTMNMNVYRSIDYRMLSITRESFLCLEWYIRNIRFRGSSSHLTEC